MVEKELSALVLLSGGMDSAVLLQYVKDVLEYDKVEAIAFNYGQSNVIELDYARVFAADLGILYKIIYVDLTQFGGSSLTEDDKDLSVVVPARNSIFLSLATAYAETRELQDVFIGCSSENFADFPDCRIEYIQAMSQALSLGNNIQGVYAPFSSMSKTNIVKMGQLRGVNFQYTWSCYHPTKEGKPCGVCHACLEREEVLNE